MKDVARPWEHNGLGREKSPGIRNREPVLAAGIFLRRIGNGGLQFICKINPIGEDFMRVLTRGDLDGLTSAVLISLVEKVTEIRFAHPKDVPAGTGARAGRLQALHGPALKSLAAYHRAYAPELPASARARSPVASWT